MTLRSLTFALIGSAVLASAIARANTEEVIQGIHGGGAPYLISYPDESGPSNRDPGIYVRDNQGSWVKIIAGKVLPAPVKGGMSLQLSMSKTTNRYESVAIIDGRVTLLSVRTDQSNPETLATFGEDSHKVIDPLSQQVVDLPRLNNSLDSNFFEATFSQNGEQFNLLLVSIKNAGYFGDGITFAVTLKPNENSSDQIQLKYAPLLIDWKFHSSQSLSELFYRTSVGEHFLVSKSVLRKFAQGRKDEPSNLSGWRKSIRGILDGSLSIKSLYLSSNVPLISIETGALAIPILPSTIIPSVGNQKIRVIHDPVNNRDVLVVMPSDSTTYSLEDLESNSVRPLASGNVACHEEACEAREISTKSSGSGVANILTMKDGRRYLLLVDNSKETQAQLIRPTDAAVFATKAPDKFSYYAVPSSPFLIFSWVSGSNAFTEIQEFDPKKIGAPLKRSLILGRSFYSSEQLAWRTHSIGKVFAFDNTTPLKDSATKSDYDKNHRFTAAHIDLEASLENLGAETYYPESLNREEVARDVFYTIFEESNKDASRDKLRTGLYLKAEENERATELKITQLLKHEGQEHWKLDSKEASIEGVKADLTLVAGDPRFAGGSRDATLYLIISPHKSGEAQVEPVFPLPSFSKVSNVLLVVEPNPDPEKPLTLLVSANIEDRGTVLRSYVFSKGKKGYDFTRYAEAELSKPEHPLSQKEIMSRIRFSTTGLPFWIETPLLDESAEGFALRDLRTNSIIEPAKQKKAVKLSENELIAKYGANYASSWRVYNFDPESREKTAKLKQSTEYQTDIFPHFRQILDELADIRKPARHAVLIVPPELRKYAQEYPMALKVREQDQPSHWSDKNPDLILFTPDQNKASQRDVLSNFKEMRDTFKSNFMTPGNKRPFLFAPLSLLSTIGRPNVPSNKEQNDAFVISDSTLSKVEFDGSNAEDKTEVKEETHYPHLLYLAATEGDKINLPEFKPEPSSSTTISTLFIGTKEEWTKLLSEAAIENAYGLENHFEVIELAPPNREFRQNFVKNIFLRREIRNFGYSIAVDTFLSTKDAKALAAADPEMLAASYFINRIETLAKTNKISDFEAFMKASNMLGVELSQNIKLRQRKVLDRSTLEGLLMKVFAMPINLNLLPAEDPLKILSKPEAPFLWLQEDYIGSSQIKEQVIRTILSQLTADEVRNASSSFIIFGDTGSGKSHIIRTLIKLLKLKEYNFSNPSENKDAWSFFLECSKIYEPGPNQETRPGMMTVQEASNHLDAFLAGDNGERGFIWLDDMHLAPPKARAYFVSKVRSLLESPHFIVRDASTKNIKERPTRNLTIGITMNPTENQERIAKFTSDKSKGPSDADLILATLSNADGSNDLDKSFLGRFGMLINLSTFPAEAKGPKLLKSTTEAAKADFTNNQRYIIVAPEAIHSVVDAFPKENARVFLSNATRGFMRSDLGDAHSLYILTPRRTSAQTQTNRPLLHPLWSESSNAVTGQTAGAKIEEHIFKNIEAIPLETGYAGKLHFTRYILDNIRKRALETLLWSMGKSPRFAESTHLRTQVGPPLARAVYHHLQTAPKIPIELLNLEARDFDAVNGNEKAKFRKELASMVLEDSIQSIAKLPDIGMSTSSGLYDDFVSGSTIDTQKTMNPRRKVLADTVTELEKIEEKITEDILRVMSLHSLPDPEAWLNALDAKDPNLVSEVGAELLTRLETYLKEMYNPANAALSDSSVPLSQYDAMRLFVMAFDRALTRLPWGKMSNFLVRSMKKASENMAYGQSRGVQHLFFESKNSPLITREIGLVLGLAESIPHFKPAEEGALERQHKRFMDNCERLLSDESIK